MSLVQYFITGTFICVYVEYRTLRIKLQGLCLQVNEVIIFSYKNKKHLTF